LVTDPHKIGYYLVFLFSDQTFFLMYCFINTYIWPSGAFTFCSIPKLVWAISLYFLRTDRTIDLMINLGLSCVSNLLQVIVAEETMVLAHNFMQNDEVSSIDFYVKMNLNIKYICEVIMATLNIKKKKVE
jgi:hypothetical protein